MNLHFLNSLGEALISLAKNTRINIKVKGMAVPATATAVGITIVATKAIDAVNGKQTQADNSSAKNPQSNDCCNSEKEAENDSASFDISVFIAA